MESKFVLGAKCALINIRSFGDSTISERTVSKVRKDGKFFVSFQRMEAGEIKTVQSEQMWTPSKYSGDKANRSGRDPYARNFLEIWTPAFDARIAENAAKRQAAFNKERLIDKIKAININDSENRKILETMLKQFPETKSQEQDNG